MTDEPGDRVTKCVDGKYRWIYEMSLFRNATIPLLLLKVALIVVLIMFALMFVIGLADGEDLSEVLRMSLTVSGIALAIILVIGTIGYLIYAASMGGKYCVVFEMDDGGVLHAQQEAQVKKASLLSFLAILAGAAAGSPTTAGAGLLAGANTSMYTEFADVRRIGEARGRNVIYVDNNQVYVCDEDFDFVLDFIRTRCPGAKN